jgi:MFS transporter, FHS family, L-fucose permease
MQVSKGKGSKNGESHKAKAAFSVRQTGLFVLLTALFVLRGMLDGLTDILVQQFRKSFELSRLLVSTANFTGYSAWQSRRPC